MRFKLLCIKLTLILLFGYGLTSNAMAAKLYLSPSTVNVNSGQSGQLTVYVDTEGKNAFGIDGVITVTGSSVTFSNISAAGKINSSELTKSIEDGKLTFRILTMDGVITGVEQVATISYSAVANGNTSLTWVTAQNFDTSSVAEDVTGAELLTSTGNTTFNVGNANVSAVCGNNVVEGTEQCEPGLAGTCPGGYSCTTTCVCIFGNISIVPTPTITITPNPTARPSGTIIPTGSPTGGTIIPTNTGVITPNKLPKSAIESEDLQIFFTSASIAFAGLVIFALFSVPEFNLELIGTRLRIRYAANKKGKFDRKKARFEKIFS